MNEQSKQSIKSKPTVGSLFAGIGGFDIGFERAGFTTAWQVEINDIAREVLRDRFPHAQQFTDVRTCLSDLSSVDVIVGGFPCQDVSLMGKRRGFEGERTSLFFNAMHIVTQLSPRWLVLENVCGLFSSNNGLDFQKVIETLAECGYVGFWRVLNAQYFGVAQSRRRVFIVCGFNEYPHWSLWVMPDQWEMFLARAKRMNNSKTPLLHSLQDSTVGQVLTLRVPAYSLSPTHGVRWLSGGERLKITGFCEDWLRPTLRRLGVRETPLYRKSQSGLPKS